MRTTHCIACNSPLLNRRPQTLTCNAACRAKHWRHSRISMIPVKIIFNLTNFALIKMAAETAGISINQYAHDRVMQSEVAQ